MINLSHEFKGYFLEEDLSIVKNASVFRDRIDLVPFASLGLKYKWNNGVTFSLNPYFELKKWKVNSTSNPIDQTYRLYGVGSSLRFHF